jgi:hypothetical protein
MQSENKHAVYSNEAVDPSKDAGNQGNNGNPAQSAGRVTAQEQNKHPEPLGDPTPEDPSRPPPKPGEPGWEAPPAPASENI